ncbi:hypothetical protein COBT_001301, partial [Conglomerata obtusa]
MMDKNLLFGNEIICEKKVSGGEDLPKELTMCNLKDDIKECLKQNKKNFLNIETYKTLIEADQHFVFLYTYTKKCGCVYCLESYEIDNEFKFDMEDVVFNLYSKAEKVITMLITYKILKFISYLDVFFKTNQTNNHRYNVPNFYHETYNHIKDKYFFKDTIKYVSSCIFRHAKSSFTGKNCSYEMMQLFCATNTYYTLLEKFFIYVFIKAYELTSHEKCKNFILYELNKKNDIASANASNFNVSAEQNTANPNGPIHLASPIENENYGICNLRVKLSENWDYFNLVLLLINNHKNMQENLNYKVFIDINNFYSILLCLNGFLNILEKKNYLTFDEAYDYFLKEFLSSTIGKISFVFNNSIVVNNHNSNSITDSSNNNIYKIYILYDYLVSVPEIFEHFVKQKHNDGIIFSLISSKKIIKLCLYIQRLTFHALKYYFITYKQHVFKFGGVMFHEFSTIYMDYHRSTDQHFNINTVCDAALFENIGISIATILDDIRSDIIKSIESNCLSSTFVVTNK